MTCYKIHTSVSKGRDVPLSLCPGTKKILVPVSHCPGTRAWANVPGQTPLSRPVPGQNDLKIFKKKDQISHFRTSASKNKCRICQRLPHNFSKTAWLYNDRVCPMSYKQYCKWKDSFTLIYRQATNGKQKYRLLRHCTDCVIWIKSLILKSIPSLLIKNIHGCQPNLEMVIYVLKSVRDQLLLRHTTVLM